MFFVSSRGSNNTVGVTDTKDGVEEFYTVNQMREILKSGIAISGAAFNKQGRLRFKVRSLSEIERSNSTVRLRMAYGGNMPVYAEKKSTGMCFKLGAYISVAYLKTRGVNVEIEKEMTREQSAFCLSSWGALGSLAVQNVGNMGLDPRFNGRLTTIDLGRIEIPKWATSVDSEGGLGSKPFIPMYGSIIFDIGEEVKTLNKVFSYWKPNIAWWHEGSPQLEWESEVSQYSGLTPDTSPHRYIYKIGLRLARELNACNIVGKSFHNVDLSGRIDIGAGVKKIGLDCFTSTEIESIHFNTRHLKVIDKGSFGSNFNLKEVVFPRNFICEFFGGELFAKCPNAKFYVSRDMLGGINRHCFAVRDEQIIYY